MELWDFQLLGVAPVPWHKTALQVATKRGYCTSQTPLRYLLRPQNSRYSSLSIVSLYVWRARTELCVNQVHDLVRVEFVAAAKYAPEADMSHFTKVVSKAVATRISGIRRTVRRAFSLIYAMMRKLS